MLANELKPDKSYVADLLHETLIETKDLKILSIYMNFKEQGEDLSVEFVNVGRKFWGQFHTSLLNQNFPLIKKIVKIQQSFSLSNTETKILIFYFLKANESKLFSTIFKDISEIKQIEMAVNIKKPEVFSNINPHSRLFKNRLLTDKSNGDGIGLNSMLFNYLSAYIAFEDIVLDYYQIEIANDRHL